MVLSKEQILQADDLPRELVSVPEWGGEVYVRTMTGAERDAYEKSILDQRGPDGNKNMENIRAKLCAKTIVSESGELLFSNSDIVALGNKSGAALDRVFDVAIRLNGLSSKDVKDLAKN